MSKVIDICQVSDVNSRELDRLPHGTLLAMLRVNSKIMPLEGIWTGQKNSAF